MPLLRETLPPIAMLHSVSDSFQPLMQDWCITKKNFLQLLHFIEQNNITTTHFADIANGRSLPDTDKIILSFDDCPRQLFDFAIPELIHRKMKAVFYMPTADMGRYNTWDVAKGAAKIPLMNETDLQELHLAGMEIGSHSHHHIDLKQIKNPAQLQAEVAQSKAIIGAVTGAPVYSFSYPYGGVPKGYHRVLSRAGYRYAVSIYQPFETTLALRRFGVYNKDTHATLANKVSLRYKWSRKLYDKIKKY